MFDILTKSLAVGVVTTEYPLAPAAVSNRARGRPEIDFAAWKDARAAAAICPTGAIQTTDHGNIRTAALDLGLCIFCGLCAEVDKAIRMTPACELATSKRENLIVGGRYELDSAGIHRAYLGPAVASAAPEVRACNSKPPAAVPGAPPAESFERLAARIQAEAQRLFGHSLHIREVDAGSCNGCEVEIVGLNSPVYDLERFGIHFVASPRHADMILVTGPVTRNMELALRKTYEAMPAPRLVVAVGACGCSGGIFGRNYATRGAVDQVVPVDVYVPGCPPNPHALLHGILLAIGRLEARPGPTASRT